jgi:predicted amidohydrolase YtcJ
MYEPYVGQPDNFGSSRVSEEELQRQIDEAFAAGWPVGVHTTGDRGIDIVASALKKGIEKVGQAPGRCHLIHVYFPREKAIDIASRHDLAIAAQPTFTRTWGETVRAFVGKERAERFKPLRTLLDRGLTVGGGADSPITWHDPWVGIYAAATRKTEGGWVLGKEERITVEEALRCYTLGSAAIFEQENVRGSIEVGKLADFTIVDRDILAIDPEQIPGTRVLKTIVGGEVVYEAAR